MKTFVIYPLIASLLMGLVSCTDIKFNSLKWKNWEESELALFMRWDMVDDLLKNHPLKGKTIQEIEVLLGPANCDSADGNCTVFYPLGPCRSGIDYGSLFLEVKNGKVVRVEKHCS